MSSLKSALHDKSFTNTLAIHGRITKQDLGRGKLCTKLAASALIQWLKKRRRAFVPQILKRPKIDHSHQNKLPVPVNFHQNTMRKIRLQREY